MFRGVLALVLLGACYAPPEVGHCDVQCPTGACPDGAACLSDGYCHAAGEAPDCQGASAQGADIRVGGQHTCAIVGDGRLACWGANRGAELGPATGEPRIARGAFVDLDGVEAWAAVAAGREHTCAITDGAGALYCWGRDDFGGAVGDGAGGGGAVPVQPADAPTEGWTAIAAGNAHSCGIADGRLYCWGTNLYDQLGLGSSAGDSADRPQVVGAMAWRAVAAAENHSCGILLEGRLFCWGDNGSGKLGVGDEIPRDEPAEVGVGGMTWKQVAVGAAHTCAIRADDTLWCWGGNSDGQLGDDVGPQHEPYPVESSLRWRAVAAGVYTSCGVTLTDQLYCWGHDYGGQRGDGLPDGGAGVTRIATDLAWDTVAMASHAQHACARTTAGDLYCWGLDGDGQIGDGVFLDEHAPVAVGGGHEFVHLVADGDRSCGIDAASGLWCWGGSTYSIDEIADEPTRVGDTTSMFVDAAVGAFHGCAIAVDHGLWCWGANSHGELGTGDDTSHANPFHVLDGRFFLDVAVGTQHTCAIELAQPNDTTGTVKCWGDNSGGQIQDRNVDPNSSSVPVDTVAGTFDAIEAGAFHTCARTTGGEIWCWGANGDGQATTGTDPRAPVEVPEAGWTRALSAGTSHSCGVLVSSLHCWGDDDKGELARSGGGSGSSEVPVPSASIAGDDWVGVAAGDQFTCGVRGVFPGETRELWCWGNSISGVTGGDALGEDQAPRELGDGTDWLEVAAGDRHACALDADGAAWCWGAGTFGQLGNGVSSRWEPTPVLAPQ